MEKLQLAVSTRTDKGKGASRRLRRLSGYIPAIIYGGKEPQPISIEHKELIKFTRQESFFSQVLSLSVDGKVEDVITKDAQRHPYKEEVFVHLDFQRVSADTKLTVHLPVHILNEDICKGVKQQGGGIFRDMIEIEITSLPSDLPGHIEVDVAELEVGQAIHLKDLVLPEGVQITALLQSEEHDAVVVRVSKLVEQTDESEDDSSNEDQGGANKTESED